MSIVVKPHDQAEEWFTALEALLPEEQLVRWPHVDEPTEVEFVIAYTIDAEDLASYQNVQAVLSLAAGAEQWQTTAMAEALGDTPIIRLHDPAMSDEMAGYALHWVLHYQRSFNQMASLQRHHRFEQPSYNEAADYRIGILGYGTIGERVGRAFADLGYPVNAWSRSGGVSSDRLTHYAGHDELNDFLATSDAVINILPSTAATTGLLTAERVTAFRPGSLLINMGRGTLIAEEVLLQALDDGLLAVAVLDVTHPEPPADDSILFDHPKVVLTGHVAGNTLVGSASQAVAANIRRLRRGERAFPQLDRGRGY